ncbi:MAG: glycosyltransferase [Paracoccaceae bacterium]
MARRTGPGPFIRDCVMRPVIVVTHLLGTGHLARAMTLARTFADAGHSPVVISGGVPAPHLMDATIKHVQLPAVRSNGVDFSKVLTPDNQVADADYLANRATQLLKAIDELQPDVLITELFPFGRRILRDEFEALLEHVQNRTPVFASIRDILAPPSSQKKADYADRMISQYYQGVLVHGDPEIAPLGLSWPVTDQLAPMLRYTGFVAPRAPGAASGTRAGILVSTGGGNVGDSVFEAALRAARTIPDHTWRFLVGGSPERVARFATLAPDHVFVEGLRDDFRTILAQSAVSISLAGYNTTLDLLQTGTPGVLVPFDEGNEVEQGLRAQALSNRSNIEVCTSDQLENLSVYVHRALVAGPQPPRTKNMDGAAETVRIVANAL